MVGHLISGPSIISAWAQAVEYMVAAGDSPTFLAVTAGAGWPERAAWLSDLDRVLTARGGERPTSVSDVLLPATVTTANGTLDERLHAGSRLFSRGRRRGIRYSGWRHTYYERLTGYFLDRESKRHEIKQENRLKAIIGKINHWGKNAEGALYLHTDAPSDRLRTRGSPCLQYVQFRLYGNQELELFALYRSHDYLNKSLGNMLGLQRLGSFVAGETGRSYTRQTVFSLHPTLGTSKAIMRALVDDVRALPGI